MYKNLFQIGTILKFQIQQNQVFIGKFRICNCCNIFDITHFSSPNIVCIKLYSLISKLFLLIFVLTWRISLQSSSKHECKVVQVDSIVHKKNTIFTIIMKITTVNLKLIRKFRRNFLHYRIKEDISIVEIFLWVIHIFNTLTIKN